MDGLNQKLSVPGRSNHQHDHHEDATIATRTTIHPLHLTPLSTPAPLHVSLSAPLVLQTLQRDAFQSAVESALQRASLHPFAVRLASSPRWVSNADRSRWFLVVGLEPPPGNELNRLLHACNQVAEAWGMPRLYQGDRRRARSGK